MFALAVVLITVSAAVSIAMDDADAAGRYNARVFFGDGTDSGTCEYSGAGSTVEDIVIKGLDSGGHAAATNANGTLKSIDGEESADGKEWVLFQWRPPVGWTITYMNSNGDRFLADGTSYYVMQSEKVTGSDGKTTYRAPTMQPVSTGYFFIQFKEDYDANQYVTSTLTEEQRRSGFWIAGSGSSMALAFKDACSAYGFELDMSDGKKGDIIDLDYVGWLFSFFGLVDEQKSGTVTKGDWKYWSQFYWDSSTDKWAFGETMGHYDPGVTKYIALVRQTTTVESVSTNLGQDPSDAPISNMIRGCKVTFVDGDGKTTVRTVPYFGTATPPATASKASTEEASYVFKGWNGNYTQVISDVTVTAEFEEIRNTTLTGVRITDHRSSLSVGATSVFKASPVPSGASAGGFAWSVSDESIASIDDAGTVVAKKEGTVTITVRSGIGGFSDSVTLEVTPARDGVWSVTIKEGDIEIGLGESRNLTANVQPADAKDRTVRWSTSDAGIVMVDESGMITAVSPGIAEITVETNDGGFTDTIRVSVSEPSGGVASIIIEGGDREATVGSKIHLKAVVEPESAKDRTVAWSVSDPGIASIDDDGNLTLLKIGFDGTVEVTARSVDGGAADTITVTILPASGQTGRVSIGDIAIKLGGSVVITPVLDAGATRTDAVWSSTDPSVVSVDPKTGEITAVSVGSVDIIVSMVHGGAEGRCTVDVYSDDDVSSIREKNLESVGDRVDAGVDDDAAEALVRNGCGYTVRTDALGSVELPVETLRKLISDGSRITLTISIFDKTGMTKAQLSVVGSSTVYEYLIDGCDVPDLGGKAKVSIPYILKDGEKATDVRVYCVDPDGNLEEFACSYDEGSGLATFDTSHFSLYFVSAEDLGASDPDDSGDGSGDGSGISLAIVAIAVLAVVAVSAVTFARVRGRI